MATEFQKERRLLEKDIQRIAAEVKKYREQVEFKEYSDEKLIRKAIESFFKTDQEDKGEEEVAPKEAAPQEKPADILPDYLKRSSAETRLEVEYLLDIAFREGVEKALKVARQTSPFVYDAFHDALVKAFRTELEEHS